MSNSQRTKGQAGEREVAAILSEMLNLDVRRNWQEQFFGGAYDLVGVPGWAIEVKRAKQENRNQWWQQALAQAAKSELKPALIFRIDGKGRGLDTDEKWRVIVPLSTVFDGAVDDPIEMTLRTWIYLLAKTS